MAALEERFVASVGDWIVSSSLERLVARVAGNYGLKTDDLSDVIQETRIALWEAGPEFPVTAAFVVRVARNKSIDLVRRLRRRRMAYRALAMAAIEAEEPSELGHLLNVRTSGLPSRLQQLIKLRYEQGLSEREIAVQWGVGRSSIRWLDRRCRRLLNRRFERATAGRDAVSQPGAISTDSPDPSPNLVARTT